MAIEKLVIDWIRHAESCSNFVSGKYHDSNNYPSREIGYDILSNLNLKFNKNTNLNTNLNTDPNSDPNSDPKSSNRIQFEYHPNLSYIGMQHAIMLGTNFIRPEIVSNPSSIVLVSATVRTIMTAMLAFRSTSKIIYVVPYINEVLEYDARFGPDHQNTPFTSNILKKQILHIKNWMETNWIESLDDIEIMSEIIRLRNLTIDQSSYHDIGCLANNILELKTNNLNPNLVPKIPKVPDLIDKIIRIYDRIQFNGIQPNNSIESIISFLRKTSSTSFLRGPVVDFSILEYFERKCHLAQTNNHQYLIHQFLRKPCKDKFYQQVLPLILDLNLCKLNSNLEQKIFCFVHGNLMREFFRPSVPIPNTQVFEEVLQVEYGTNSKHPIFHQISIIFDKYIPTKIRTKYQNFEFLNQNICDLKSLFGDINYPQVTCLALD